MSVLCGIQKPVCRWNRDIFITLFVFFLYFCFLALTILKRAAVERRAKLQARVQTATERTTTD
jgi:hypothetical protein